MSAAPAGSSKVFNPDMSVIGNFLGVAGSNPLSTQPPLQLTEAEVAFQAIVDPYARADFFLAAGPEGLEVEEGFITFTALPANLLLKVGKMRAQFGKVNTLHTHAMPTADRPLVTENLVGGEEGLSDSGLSLSHLIHNPSSFSRPPARSMPARRRCFRVDEAIASDLRRPPPRLPRLTESTNIDFGIVGRVRADRRSLPDAARAGAIRCRSASTSG